VSQSWQPSDVILVIPNALPVLGEPFIWAFALPVLAVFLVFGIVWAVKILRSAKPHRWRWWLLTAALWIIAICVDFAHH
jgi:hypothetical protein